MSQSGSHAKRDLLEIDVQVALLTVATYAARRTPQERQELIRIFPQYILEGREPRPEETGTGTHPTTGPVTPTPKP